MLPIDQPAGEMSHEALLRGVPFFRDLDRVSVARLAGALEELRVPEGRTVVHESDEADGLYLVETGELTIHVTSESGDIEVGSLTAPGYFGDLGLLLARRTATVRTRTAARLWRLPKDRFVQVVRESPEIGLVVATSLADRFERTQRTLVGAPELTVQARPLTIDRPGPARIRPWRVAVTVLGLALPLLLWNVAPPDGLDARAWRVLLVLVGAALGWLGEAVPDFVVALALAVGWGVSGLAGVATVFGGFATATWILGLGALTLAGAMARSGLLFRSALFLLRAFPVTHRSQMLALLFGGVVITPLVPHGVARISAVAPVTSEIATSLGQAPRSRGSAGLAFAGLIGYYFFSHVFLTGFAGNFFVLELVPEAERARFTWGGWLVASAVAGIVSLAGAVVALLVLFKPEREPRISRAAVHRQLRIMAGLSRAEKMALLAVGILIVGMVLQPLIGISPEWLAIASTVVAVAGVLGRDGFRTGIDWPFLMFFGILLGSAPVLQEAGVDGWLASRLAPLGAVAPHPGLIVMGLAVLVLVVRLMLPSRPTLLLMSLVAMPIAPGLGISAWVAGFVVLLASTTWIAPYQGLEYLIVRDATRGEAFTDRHGVILGAVLTAVRLVAIAASVPYWMAIGLIGP